MQAPPDALFQAGFALHRAGRTRRALALYRRVLRGTPDHADALHLGGLILHGEGRHDAALDCISRAIARSPTAAHYHDSLGSCLRALGRPADAEAAYRRALDLRPGLAEAGNNLALLLWSAGRDSEAEACHRAALGANPGNAIIHTNLAQAFLDRGRAGEAEAMFRDAVRLNAQLAPGWLGLGTALLNLHRPAEAEASFRAALRLRPDLAEAHNNLGNALRQLGRGAAAEACYRAALALRSGFADAWFNLGNAAAAAYRLAEAEGHYRTALRHAPEDARSHFNLGYVLLLGGRMTPGWAEMEWRWRLPDAVPLSDEAPRWTGGALDGKTLLLRAEQGLGDTIQFCRYAPLLARRTRVLLQVQPPLRRLLASLPGVETVADDAPPHDLPPHDLHCPLLSLPLACDTRLETIPGATPYLTADPAMTAAWRARLAGLPGPRVGLVWAGRAANTAIDARRSLPAELLSVLDDSPASFVSLQKQPRERPSGLALHDWTAELDDFADTAALVSALDLVIGVDTAVTHLAGALNRPVWLLNRKDTDWRWLLGREDSPWYPTMRIFRQQAAGDWAGVLAEVVVALRSEFQTLPR